MGGQAGRLVKWCGGWVGLGSSLGGEGCDEDR